MNDRDGRAPVALARNAPVAQTVLRFLFAAVLCRLCCDVIYCGVKGRTAHRAGVDAGAVIAIVRLPGIGRIGFASVDDLLDR